MAERSRRRPGEIRQGELGWEDPALANIPRPGRPRPSARPDLKRGAIDEWRRYRIDNQALRDDIDRRWLQMRGREAAALAHMKAAGMTWDEMQDATGWSLGVLQRKLKRARLSHSAGRPARR